MKLIAVVAARGTRYRVPTMVPLALTLVLLSRTGNASDPPPTATENARAILDATSVKGGLIVHPCPRPASLCASIGWQDRQIDPPKWVI